MTDDRFAEVQLWVDNPDAWQEPTRCDDWIRLMQEIVENQSERPEDRAEAEMLVARLKAAKRSPRQPSETGAG
jgi:hypothetical protein